MKIWELFIFGLHKWIEWEVSHESNWVPSLAQATILRDCITPFWYTLSTVFRSVRHHVYNIPETEQEDKTTPLLSFWAHKKALGEEEDEDIEFASAPAHCLVSPPVSASRFNLVFARLFCFRNRYPRRTCIPTPCCFVSIYVS